MTAEGRLARGKFYYDSGQFPNNAETLAYKATLTKAKPKEAKDAKPAK